ncbi:MAG: hypothetical protein HY560_13225 [Gemmatimonadetes bacterium]|nr:hypothetical protein [Gemmatimonadota bacterium]
MSFRFGWWSMGVGCVLVAATVAPAGAQGRAPSFLSISAGATQYDLSGTGTTYVIAARIDGAIGSYGIFEPGVTFLSYEPDFGGRLNYLLPEISFQGQVYVGRLRPYLGAGIGFANITNGPNFNELTLHLTGGGRIRLAGPWGIRFEVRARTIDPWRNSTADFTVGVSRMMLGGGF